MDVRELKDPTNQVGLFALLFLYDFTDLKCISFVCERSG